MNKDTLLIHRMKNGDENAIEQFVTKYYLTILRYCRLHISDMYEAKDITQDTFERFFRKFEGYREYGKALNYLYVIAANTCKDYYKKRKELLPGELPEPPTNNINSVYNTDNTIMIDARIDIKAALQKLPEECREVTILHFFQGLKLREIATILNIGLPLVKYRIQKAKKELERDLRKEDYL